VELVVCTWDHNFDDVFACSLVLPLSGKNFVDFIHTLAQLSLRIKKNWTDVKKPAFIPGCIKQKPSYPHTG
jgi:hypothetical protein